MSVKSSITRLSYNWEKESLRELVESITPEEFINIFGVLDEERTWTLIHKSSKDFGSFGGNKSFITMALDGDIDEDWLYILNIPYIIKMKTVHKDIRFTKWVFNNIDKWMTIREEEYKRTGSKVWYERWYSRKEVKLRLSTKDMFRAVLQVKDIGNNQQELIEFMKEFDFKGKEKFYYDEFLGDIKSLFHYAMRETLFVDESSYDDLYNSDLGEFSYLKEYILFVKDYMLEVMGKDKVFTRRKVSNGELLNIVGKVYFYDEILQVLRKVGKDGN